MFMYYCCWYCDTVRSRYTTFFSPLLAYAQPNLDLNLAWGTSFVIFRYAFGVRHNLAYINKIVFKNMWYVLAWLSISSNLLCLHNSSCGFKCYSIHCMCQIICDVTYTQRVKTAWLCVGLAVCGFGCKNPSVGSLHKINGPEKQLSHLTGPPCSVQVWLIS